MSMIADHETVPNIGAVQQLPGADWEALVGPLEAPTEFRLSGSKAWYWPEGEELAKRDTARVFKVVANLKAGPGPSRRADGSWGLGMVFDVLEAELVE